MRLCGTGQNDTGQLTGNTTNKYTLTDFTGLPNGVTPVKIAVSSRRVLVLGSDHLVYGTGDNNNGELTGSGARTTLTILTGLPNGVTAIEVATGLYHSLVLGSDGILYGTGLDSSSQLGGIGNKTTLSAMPALPNGVGIASISAGWYHTIALGSDGAVYGVGAGAFGQLTGTTTTSSWRSFTGLPNGITASAISGGHEITLVVGSDGKPYGTGYNGQYELTGSGNKSTLTVLSGLPNGVTAVQVSAGVFFHCLVLGSDGIPYGTGFNSSNQLTGSGNKSTLTPLSGLPNAVSAIQVVAGYDHSIVIGSDGIPYGTGGGAAGQLTSSSNLSTLTAMSGLPQGAKAIYALAGNYFSVVLVAVYIAVRDSALYGDSLEVRNDLVCGEIVEGAASIVYADLIDVKHYISYSDDTVSNRIELSTSDSLECLVILSCEEGSFTTRVELSVSDTVDVRVNLSYDNLYLAARVDITFDLNTAIKVSNRIIFCYESITPTSARCSLQYDLDGFHKLSKRVNLSYKLHPDPTAHIQTANFTLRSLHG